jgi:hypothetical protein
MYEILSPHAKEVVVAAIGESRGQKDDARDAYKLAEQLRTGALKTRVFKEVGEYKTLGELGRTHAMLVQDVVRVQNRIKALLRSRGVAVEGKNVYSKKGREEFVQNVLGARAEVSARRARRQGCRFQTGGRPAREGPVARRP